MAELDFGLIHQNISIKKASRHPSPTDINANIGILIKYNDFIRNTNFLVMECFLR